jgi:hypothetical protein
VVGLKRLRSRDIGAHLEELNLSDCNLSDVSLYLIALQYTASLLPRSTSTTDDLGSLSLLQPSPHPPSIKALFLNHNHFSLGSESSLTSISETLGTTLSSSSSSLRSIAFTSNRAIAVPLTSPRFASPSRTSRLNALSPSRDGLRTRKAALDCRFSG